MSHSSCLSNRLYHAVNDFGLSRRLLFICLMSDILDNASVHIIKTTISLLSSTLKKSHSVPRKYAETSYYMSCSACHTDYGPSGNLSPSSGLPLDRSIKIWKQRGLSIIRAHKKASCMPENYKKGQKRSCVGSLFHFTGRTSGTRCI